MNILIPHQWLLEHLESNVSPEKLQEVLSLSGPSVERIYQTKGDSVYDIEVTTNRVDSMCVRGIAREAAVILNNSDLKAKLKNLELPEISKAQASDQLPLPTIDNAVGICNRITCVVLKNVERVETPKWMADRLEQVEIGVHDAAIDITNYITHELGHPCHAFDYDKIMKLGGTIHVKEATAGKNFTTLDGESYETVGGEIVFENNAGEIIDLPAIKGTANTAIDENTSNILLWIESIPSKKVRFASMTHAIRTVAAQLNEKNVDPELATDVLKFGVKLYSEICNAKVASQVFDQYSKPLSPAKVTVRLSMFKEYLGIDLDAYHIESILNKLGCKTELNSKQIEVTPPTFRPDLTIPADIIEEVARIYGYHNLPSKLMDTRIPTTRPEYNYQREHQLKSFLANIGWQEIFAYSMVSQEIAEQSGFELEEQLKLLNPLTADREYLRRSLLPSLVEVLDNNKDQDLSVFELASVYHPTKNDLPQQPYMLGMVSNEGQDTKKAYRKLKGSLESLLDNLFISPLEVVEGKNKTTNWHQVAEVLVTDREDNKINIGLIGVLKTGQAAAEINVEELLNLASNHPLYKPMPKTAMVQEDVTLTLPKKVLVGEIIENIRSSHSWIYSVELKDIYQQNFTFTITYNDEEQNLSSDLISPIRKNLIEKLIKEFDVKLVGEL